jgi:hypothetical protein
MPTGLRVRYFASVSIESKYRIKPVNLRRIVAEFPVSVMRVHGMAIAMLCVGSFHQDVSSSKRRELERHTSATAHEESFNEYRI